MTVVVVGTLRSRHNYIAHQGMRRYAKIGTSLLGVVHLHFVDATGCGREEYVMLHKDVMVDDLVPPLLLLG